LDQSNETKSFRTTWGVVFAALTMGVVAALHIGKVPPALPLIREELGLGLVGGGFVISMFSGLGMLLGVLTGGLADRIGHRRTTLIGFLFLVAGGCMGASADGLPGMLTSRALEGLGFMAVGVTMPGIVSAASSARDRPLALGLWSVFTPLGFAIALLLTPMALTTVGWRTVWVGLAGLSLVTLLVLRPMLPLAATSAPVARRSFGQRLSDVLARPRLWLIAAAFGAYAFQWVTVMAWLPTYLVDDLGFSLGAASSVTALIVVVNVPGNIGAGALMRAGWSPRRIIVIGSCAMGVTASALFLGSGLGALAGIGLCLLFSVSGGGIPAALFAQIPQASPSPSHAGQANGMLMQGSATGQFLGPPLIGAAVAAAGGAWSGAVAPLAIAAVLTALLARPMR
jgi:cyanate permease